MSAEDESEEDFVDFDEEEEHAEDVTHQLQRLAGPKGSATSPAASELKQQDTTSSTKLNPNAAIFTPSTEPIPSRHSGVKRPFQVSGGTNDHARQSFPEANQNTSGWHPQEWQTGGSLQPTMPNNTGAQQAWTWQQPPPFSTPTVQDPKKKGWGQFTATTTHSQQRAPLVGNPSQSPGEDGGNKRVRTNADEGQMQNHIELKTDAEIPPSNETACTIVVSRIPANVNNIMKLASHFSQFGEVVNVRIDLPKSKAFVQFSDPLAAKQAFHSPQAVLHNRIIRVERMQDHRDESTSASTKVLQASPPVAESSMKIQQPMGDNSAAVADVAPSALPSFKKLSYRAPLNVISTVPAAVSTALYDSIDSTPSRPRDGSNALNKAIQKASMKVVLHEKALELARKKLTTLADKMKGIREKLDEIAKLGKAVDPTVKSEVLAQMTSLASEMKNSQTAVKSAESKLKDARKEYSDLEASTKEESPAPNATLGTDASATSSESAVMPSSSDLPHSSLKVEDIPLKAEDIPLLASAVFKGTEENPNGNGS